MISTYDFSANTIDGKQLPLSQFKGKVMLIVNTASSCGFTPQLQGLEALHRAYVDRGLVVMGFPCNQFGGQDPKSNAEILSFCQHSYGVTFLMMEKIKVNGSEAHPLFQWLCEHAPGILGSKFIKWNFTKFLVNSQGQVIRRYSPQHAPDKISGDIESVLPG